MIENAKLQEIRTAGNYDLCLSNGNMNDASPAVYLNLRVWKDEHKHGLVDDVLFDNLEKASVTVDAAKRAEYYRAAVGRMRELFGPVVGLYSSDNYAAIGYGITGCKLDLGGQQYFQFIDYNVDDPTSTDHDVDWEKILP